VSCKKYYALKQTHSEEEPSLAFLELEKEREKTGTLYDVVLSSHLAKRRTT
jgi:hypothetical protein